MLATHVRAFALLVAFGSLSLVAAQGPRPVHGPLPASLTTSPGPGSQSSSVRGILRVDPAGLDCNMTADFEDVEGGPGPGTSYDEILALDGLAFAERFAGQTQVDFGFISDRLEGLPTSPLELALGAPNENVSVHDSASQRLYGLGPEGFPSGAAIGEGSVAGLFGSDQGEFGFTFAGGNWGSLTVRCYRRDGSRIGAVSLTATPGTVRVALRQAGGLRQIAGFTIENLDMGGIAYDDFCYQVPTSFMLDFSTEDDFLTHLVNGQDIGAPDEFGARVTISGAGDNHGPAIFDSTPGGRNIDPQDDDLMVDTGNLLILQNDNNAVVSQQTVPGVFDLPNDDPDGGTIGFDFGASPVVPLSIRLVDIDVEGAASEVVLTDVAGGTRTYTMPDGWTGDRTLAQPGLGTLDLQLTTPQPGFASTATAAETPGYDPERVVQIDVHLAGSGAVDDLSWSSGVQRLVASQVEVRNGMGSNPTNLTSWGPPLPGGTWTTGLDCSGHGDGMAILFVGSQPRAGLASPLGEFLVEGADVVRAQGRSGHAAFFALEVPPDPGYQGLRAHAQGLCTGSPGARFSNALDVTIGF